MHSIYHSVRPLPHNFKNKQKAYKEKKQLRLLTQDAEIILLKFKEANSYLCFDINNRENRLIFSIIAGLAGLVVKSLVPT